MCVFAGENVIVGPNIVPGMQEVRMLVNASNNQMSFLCMDRLYSRLNKYRKRNKSSRL